VVPCEKESRPVQEIAATISCLVGKLWIRQSSQNKSNGSENIGAHAYGLVAVKIVSGAAVAGTINDHQCPQLFQSHRVVHLPERQQACLVSSQGCERIAPFLTLCGVTIVFEIRVPTFFLSLTMVHRTWKRRPTKAAAHMTF
jgi:hypothetical protein